MQTITYSYNSGNVSPTVNIKYQQDIKKHVKKVSAATVTTSKKALPKMQSQVASGLLNLLTS